MWSKTLNVPDFPPPSFTAPSTPAPSTPASAAVVASAPASSGLVASAPPSAELAASTPGAPLSAAVSLESPQPRKTSTRQRIDLRKARLPYHRGVRGATLVRNALIDFAQSSYRMKRFYSKRT